MNICILEKTEGARDSEGGRRGRCYLWRKESKICKILKAKGTDFTIGFFWSLEVSAILFLFNSV